MLSEMHISHHKRPFVPIFILICGLMAFVALSACSGEQRTASAAGPGGATGERAAAPVVVSMVEQRNIPVQLTAIGNVEAYQTVQVRSQVNGQIASVNFKEGQDVRKGQLLFSLDKGPFEADLERAIGQLKKDQAQAQNSQVQAARYTELEKQGVIAKQVADQQRAQAQADASAVYADEATVKAARIQLQYSDIRAPINARAGALQINLGNLVKANDTPFLVQLNQIAPIYVTFSIPETQLDEVRHFAAGHLKVLAYPKGQRTNPSEGMLTFIDNAVDPQTGTVKLKATFTNKERRLWPGEFVDAVLNLSTVKNAVVVASSAIQSGQQGQYLYVVTPQNTAESRVVATSGTFQNLTIVTKGLTPGERVVVQGQLRVAPNGKVMVQSTVAPDAAPGSGQATPTGGGQ